MTALRPTAIAFDVIETLFALTPLTQRFDAYGLPPGTFGVFFAGLLRDAFALDAAGGFKSFGKAARAGLALTLANHGIAPDETRVAALLDCFAELPAHPDVRPAFERLREAGMPVAALPNGSETNTRGLLRNAGVEGMVEKVISIEAVGRWKPHREVYLYAAAEMGVPPSRLALGAAHAWDTHGAKQAGLFTGWVRRQDAEPLAAMSAPDVRGTNLTEVVEALLALPEA